MCGLCGVVFADVHRTVLSSSVESMCHSLRHRGPDDSGLFLDGPVGLGHRRLSIVDLASGHQPMENEDGSVVIVFNGEVYNHADLRKGLKAKGHQFRTRSDTEVIIHQYEEDGPDCASRFQGMFAFAIWDTRRRRLVLARDHSGIKPLYFGLTEAGDLVFGSEIKALYASGLLHPELETDALPEYLATGHVAGERTLLRDVKKLLPGHWMVWEAGRTRTERYWSPPPAAPGGERSPLPTMAAAGEQFWARFVEAVRSQLMSDVPLGAFLSGGLDSSLLVAAMREAGVVRPETFSVGYAEAVSSELPWARVAARAFGTQHHEVLLDEEGFFAEMPDLTWQRDLPLTFSASIPLHFVSKLAAQHVKVVLTGEGSDELFAGYGRYPRALLNLRWGRLLDSRLPPGLRRSMARFAGSLGNGWLGSRLRRSFLVLPGDMKAAYMEAFSDVNEALRADLLGGPGLGWDWAGPLRFLDLDLVDSNPLEAMLRLDQATYLEELLMKQDAMSMANSIESRVPFLDHHLIEWAAELDPHSKLSGFTGKAVVRAAAVHRLPAVLQKGPKRGFLVPLAGWLRAGVGREMVEEVMLSSLGDSVLSLPTLRRLWERHQAGTDESPRLWRLLAFRLWQAETLPRFRVLSEAGQKREDRS